MSAEPQAIPDSLTVHWLGHATVLLEFDGVRILTDPVLRNRVGLLRRHSRPVGWAEYAEAVDAVLISHLHHDHLDLPSLRMLDPRARVVVPRGAGRLLRRAGFSEVEELNVDGTVAVRGVSIRATPANHPGGRRPFGPHASALGYLIEGSWRVYFAGDTDVFCEMATLGATLDVALLPVGGWGPTLGPGHLDPARAVEALRFLRPRAALPIHWGTLWPLGLRHVRPTRFHLPAREFAAEAAIAAPSVSVVVIQPGSAVQLQRNVGGDVLALPG